MRMTHLALALVFASTACGRPKEAARPPATDSAAMQMAMQGMQMIPPMRAHLDSLGAMSADQIAAAMAAHQDLASRMMDAMGADMRGMNMQPDSAWTALGDSLRQDLADLPGHTGIGLKTRMEVHIGRMRRMLEMHEGMMKM